MLKLIYFHQPVIIFLSVLPQKIQVPHIFVIKTEILSNYPANLTEKLTLLFNYIDLKVKPQTG